MTRARALLHAVVLLGLGCGDDLPTSSAQGSTTTGGDSSGGDETAPPATICTAGDRLCGSGEVLVCADDGTQWIAEACPGDQICLDGACQADALVVTTELLLPATIGFDYAATVQAAGGEPPYAWTVGDGELPPGLALGSDGAVTGMPTTAGDYVFETRVEDSTGSMATRSFSMTVHSEPLTIITLPDLGVFDEGIPMQESLLALGGMEPYGWFLVEGTLPEGVVIDAAGAVMGTPLQPGPFDFRIRVVDAQRPPGWDEQDFSMQVDLRPLSVVGEQQYDLLVFKVIVLPLLAIIPGVDVPYMTQLEADGGLSPYTWTEQPLPGSLDLIIPQSGVPADLVLSPSGELSGTVNNADQVVTVPLIGAGVDLTGFFFYAQVSDSQAPAETAEALFLIPTLPI